VVVLDEPFGGTNGDIPTVDWLEQYRGPAHASQTFEVVGYGLTRALPHAAEGGDTRIKGLVTLHTLNAHPRDSYAVFSNTPSARASGGTCFGDSGGPVFDNTNSIPGSAREPAPARAAATASTSRTTSPSLPPTA
jgi:hypothetical protein